MNLNIDLIQRLDGKNLMITHLRNQLEAYTSNRIAVGGKDLNTLLHLALHPCRISTSMLSYRGFIAACDRKASSAEDVTHNNESTGWGRKRDCQGKIGLFVSKNIGYRCGQRNLAGSKPLWSIQERADMPSQFLEKCCGKFLRRCSRLLPHSNTL